MSIVQDAILLFTYHFDRCSSCFRNPYPSKDKVHSIMGTSTICEMEIKCGKCDKPHDYFAYGSYLRDSDFGQAESEHPELSWAFAHMKKIVSQLFP
jgi:hypothetical protein